MAGQSIRFPSGTLQLEGALHLPLGRKRSPAVVVCHPHPLYGGDMSNNVVMAVCEAIVNRGIAVLRFNFRGVGASDGRYGNGVGEQKDVRAAVSFLASIENMEEGRLGVVGYSFGAYVGLAAGCADDRVRAVCAISLPVLMSDSSSIRDCAKPKLFISGSNDDFTSPAMIGSFVSLLSEPKRLIIAKADHFWLGVEKWAADPAAEFFAESLLSK